MPISPQQQAEVLRKAKNNIALTNPTSATTTLYKSYQQPKPVAQTSGINDVGLSALSKSTTGAGTPLPSPLSYTNPVTKTDVTTADTSPQVPDINAMYSASLGAQMAKINAARQTALSGLAGQDDLIHQSAYDNRNSSDVVSMQNAQKLRQAMADQGILNSGDNLTAMAQGNAQRQGSLGAINLDESNKLKQLAAARDAIINSSSQDEIAALSQNQADRMGAQLGQYNSDRQFGLDQGQLIGSYMPEGAQNMIKQVTDLGESWKTAAPDQRTAIHEQADKLRAALRNMGIDTSSIDANAKTKNASGVLGVRTLAGQTMDYNKAKDARDFNYQQDRDKVGDSRWDKTFNYSAGQDSIHNNQWLMTFKENARQFGVEAAARQAGISIDEARLALSQDDNDRAWTELDYKMQNPAGGDADKYSGMSPDQLLGSIKSVYSDPVYEKDIYGNQKQVGTKITTDQKRREQMFLDVVDSHLPSDEATTQVLLSLGFNKKEIEALKQRDWQNGGK